MKESGSALPDLHDPFVRIGDHVCLYCAETQGYTFCESTSCSDNGVLLYHGQDKENPSHVVNPQAVTFKICIENRYKFNKRLRQLKESITNPDDPENVRIVEHALEAAEAESKDNVSEQERLNGKRLKYGDVIQFRHLFTEKYLHVHRDRTSSKDKSFLETLMLPYDAKQTKFKVLPKYKVNIEGEFVRTKDKVVIESVKYPSHYLHASKSFLREDKQPVSELNLGPSATTFTMVKRYVPDDLEYLWRYESRAVFDIKGALFGGVIVQLHHKHLEAYLTAVGLPGDALQEDVHFMIRESNAREPQSMRRPRYSSTYWQIEHEKSIISGEPLGWGCNVRLRHLQSRNYLYINAKDGSVALCNDKHPYTVFKLHPMYEDPQSLYIRDGMFTRLEHCVTGRWLHGDKDVPYHRQMASLLHKEKLVQASASEEMQYEDAFSMHRMDYSDMRDIHYILGIIPLFRAMITGIHVGGELSEQEVITARLSLTELRDFVEEKRERRRYLREFKVIDILMRIVMMYGLRDEHAEYSPVVMIYEVLYSTVTDNDMESSLYLTKYMDFLQKHIQIKASHAFYVTRIITELYRDKKQVMSSMTHQQMEQSIQLLRKYKHRVYLQFLSTLCVCNGVAIPEHQSQLCQALVSRKRGFLFRFELKGDGLVYVWKRRTKDAVTLLSVVQKLRQNLTEDEYDDALFIREQLCFFLALCHGRNEMCIQAITAEYLSMEVISSIIQSNEMPPDVRATFCDILIVLYINVSGNVSILERLANVYVYEKVSRDKDLQEWMGELMGDNKASELLTAEVMDWVLDYVKKNAFVKGRQEEENGLMVSVLRLLYALIQCSPFDARRVYESILPAILQLITGKESGSKHFMKRDSFILAKLKVLSRKSTFFLSPTKKGNLDNKPALEVRHQAMCLLELLINIHRHFKLEMFLGQFKRIEMSETDPNAKRHRLADFLHIDDSSKVKGHWWMTSPTTQLQDCLDKINRRTEITEIRQNFKQLVRVAGLNHDEITTKALQLVDRYCNENTLMLEEAHNAQLLVCDESLQVRDTVKDTAAQLRRLVSVKVDAVTINHICNVLDQLASCCTSEEAGNSVAQNVLVNYGLLDVLRDILQMEEQGKNGADSITYESLIRQTLKLLLEMSRNNHRVQEILFYSLNILLEVKYATKHLAELLKEIFRDNDTLCWKVESQHIEKIFQLIALHRDRVPNLVQVLQYVITVGDGHFRRAIQHMILRICWEKQREAASNAMYSFALSVDEKQKIIAGEHGHGAQAYFVHAVNLAVLSSRGVKGPVPDLIPEDEILQILNKKDLCNNMRRPFIKYLVYLSLARGTPGLRAYIMHHDLLWAFIEETAHLLTVLQTYLDTAIHQRNLKIEVRQIDDDFVSSLASEPNLEDVLLCYVVDAIVPLMSAITEVFVPEVKKYRREVKILTRFMKKFMLLCPDLARTLQSKQQLRQLVMTLHSGGTCCSFDRQSVNDVIAECERNFEPERDSPRLDQRHVAARVEHKLNRKLRNFVSNCKLLFEKKNTVNDQLQVSSKMEKSILNKKYCEENSPERLPLHTDFQRHARAFVRTETKFIPVPEKFCDIVVLISKLESAGRSARAQERWEEQHDLRLELRCLRIVRVTLYNNIVLMPDDLNIVGKPINKFKRLERIKELQNFYTQHGLVSILLNLMNIQNDVIFWEVMALLNCMLYQANSIVQNEILRFFTQTSEEVFFMRVQDFLKQAALMAKERRSIKHHMQRHQVKEEETKKSKKHGGFKFLRFLKPTKIDPESPQEADSKKEEPEKDYDLEQLQHFQDDGTVELTLKVVAKMCDGQHTGLQNYLRHQPDNPRSYNLVARITEYLQVSFQSVHADSIQLVIQVFDTLNELCAGNQENRNVILDGKVVDYINFLLRMERFDGCSLQSTLQLYRTISDLLISMIEESSPEAFKVAKDVGSTLDINAVAKTMMRCHNYQSYWWNLFTTQDDIELRKSVHSSKKVSQLAKKVGYKFYIVYARIQDVNEGRFARDNDVLLSCGRAIEYYGNNVLSIEVVKDGHLQKIYFPSSRSKKNLIRSELKESLKWNIDRSSPSEKIRDFMVWSKLIMTSINYQQKVQSNPGSKFLTEYIMIWNYIVIFLSFVLNIFMLSTWRAPFSVRDIPDGVVKRKDLNDSLYSPRPMTDMDELTYFWTFLGLAMAHNIFTFILFCAFVIADNPKFPKLRSFSSLFRKRKSVAKDTTKDSITYVLSLKTLYHLLLLLFSLLGTFFYGYFFAFHLLNIVNTNELLKSVLKAVTLNGKSLLWVAVLGVIWLYIYALVGFGLFRSVFDPVNELYCASLFQCTVTIIRYGLVGDIDEVLRRHPAENSFTNFGYLTIYQITFFIFFTTIGLNIIFGIIVDTFSELRDLKWRAEKDMRDCCFICSLPSYDFEHHARGFYFHVQHEHNMWSYIYYFIYLTNTNVNDYTALDCYVHRLFMEEKYDFFPVNKALSLSHFYVENEEEDRLDMLASDVNSVLLKVTQQDDLRRTRKEKKQQDRWRKKYARKFRRPRTSSIHETRGGDDDDGGGGGDTGGGGERGDDDDEGGGGGVGYASGRSSAPSGVAAKVRKHKRQKSDARDQSRDQSATEVPPSRQRTVSTASSGQTTVLPRSQATAFIPPPPPTQTDSSDSPLLRRRGSGARSRSGSMKLKKDDYGSDTSSHVTSRAAPSESFASQIRARAQERRAKLFEKEAAESSPQEKRPSLTRHMTLGVRAKGQLRPPKTDKGAASDTEMKRRPSTP